MCVVAGKQTPLCYPSSVSSARATMLFNLGSAYCLRSEYEKARKCLHQVSTHLMRNTSVSSVHIVNTELQSWNCLDCRCTRFTLTCRLPQWWTRRRFLQKPFYWVFTWNCKMVSRRLQSGVECFCYWFILKTFWSSYVEKYVVVLLTTFIKSHFINSLY